MPRPQFRLSTLLWITLAVACWFGGAEWQKRRALTEREAYIERIRQRVELLEGKSN